MSMKFQCEQCGKKLNAEDIVVEVDDEADCSHYILKVVNHS